MNDNVKRNNANHIPVVMFTIVVVMKLVEVRLYCLLVTRLHAEF